MPVTTTKAEALRIQRDQVAHYQGVMDRMGRPVDVAALVAAHTRADDLADGVEIDIVAVNRAIPRGGRIERLVGLGDQGGA